MRKIALGAVIGATLGFCGSASAVTLVTPQGQPVGGKWQRWADQAKVPTYRGNVVFTTDVATFCGGAPACSTGEPWGSQPTPRYEIAATMRWQLYFELGHIFDWAYLTWPARRRLAAHVWRVRWHWQDSRQGLAQNTEDGLEGVFPAFYQECAFGSPIADLALWGPTGVRMPPTIYPISETATCTFTRYQAKLSA